MTDTINDKTPKNLWDSPEPDKNFNKTVAESKVSAASAIYTKQRPKDEEYFRCFDPSGKGDASVIKKRLIVSMPIKGRPTDFLVLGSKEFQMKVKEDFGKARSVILAMYETVNGRTDIWPVKEPIENQNGNVNGFVATAYDIFEKSLTRWVRCVNSGQGYYDGFYVNDEKEAALKEEGKPEFKEDTDTVAEKAFQGFILHEGNYDTDPHVKEFLGYKMQNKIVKDEKGKKIN